MRADTTLQGFWVSLETYNRHKLIKRLEIAAFKIDPNHIDVPRLVDTIEARIKNNISTARINDYAIQAAVNSESAHPAYNLIAAHLEISTMHKKIGSRFSDSMKTIRDGATRNLFSKEFLQAVEKHHQILDSSVVHLRDYDHTRFSDTIKDIQKQVLVRNGERIAERIQHMYMRVAVAIHLEDIPSALATYELLSNRQVTLDYFFSSYAGTTERVMCSAYSMALSHCTVQDMYDAVARAVFAVRRGGTVAVSAQGVPCIGRNILCKHTDSNIGLWNMLKFMDGAVAFARNHEDRRTDLINVSVEIWHTDIRSLVDYNNMHQHDLADHKSLSATICIPDIFMTRVDDDGEWTMFCPKNVPDLVNLTGTHFHDAYQRYETSPSTIPRIRMRARELWQMILRSIILTGGPSIVFKDNFNGTEWKSNLTNVSPSGHADLRTGFIDVLGEDDELYPRSQMSVSLPLLVTRDRIFDFDQLHHVTKQAVYILNKSLDTSNPRLVALFDRNKDHRCIAVGLDGLADVFAAMRMPYESLEAADLNVRIAETMYHAALEASWELAAIDEPHANFSQSPLANGIMQFDFWDVKPTDRYDWRSLCERIRTTGVRNASLIAIGPGSDEAWSPGSTKSVDPYPSNVDGRIVSPWLIEDLTKLGIWSDNIHDDIVAAKGSIQHIAIVPADIKAIYRTAWEIDPKSIIKMALGRAPFVCHSQGISFHMESPNVDQLGDILMRACGTGSSYEEDTDREMSFDDILLTGSST
ncbi:hypothetical protein B0H13DRAFT_2377521 [Mycena leptocephala]|nr:hypothetical protein B0H13DRAFT_2377521 [Mycena leptocephala]